MELARTISRTRAEVNQFDGRQKLYFGAALALTIGRLAARVVVEHCADRQHWSGPKRAVAGAMVDLADNFDGRLARTGEAVTSLGKVIDPLADKVDFAIQEAYRLHRGQLPALQVALRLGRDAASTAIRDEQTKRHNSGTVTESQAGAVWAGKASTAIRSGSLRLLDLAPNSRLASLASLGATAALGVSLAVNYRNLRRK